MSKWAIYLSSKFGISALAISGEDDPNLEKREKLKDFVRWIDITKSMRGGEIICKKK